MHRDEPGETGTVLDGHVSRELRAVRDEDAVANVAIMREVHVRHDEAALADARLERRRGAAIDGRVLAHRTALADFDEGLLTLELEILRIAAEDRTAADADAWPEVHVALEDRTERERAAIADDAAVADVRVGSDADPLTDLRLRRDDRRGMN